MFLNREKKAIKYFFLYIIAVKFEAMLFSESHIVDVVMQIGNFILGLLNIIAIFITIYTFVENKKKARLCCKTYK